MRYSKLTSKQQKRSDNVTCRKFGYKDNHLSAKDSATGIKETKAEFAERLWDERRGQHTLAWFKQERLQSASDQTTEFPDTNETA